MQAFVIKRIIERLILAEANTYISYRRENCTLLQIILTQHSSEIIKMYPAIGTHTTWDKELMQKEKYHFEKGSSYIYVTEDCNIRL